MFFDHIQAIQYAEDFRPAFDLEDVVAALDQIQVFLNATKTILDGEDDELQRHFETLIDAADAIKDDVRVVSLSGMRVFSVQVRHQRDQLAGALFDLGILALLLFGVLLFSAMILAHSVEIGRRRAAQNRVSQSRLRAIATTSQDGILVSDREGRILDFSGTAEEMFGYSKDEVLGARMMGLVVPSPSSGAPEVEILGHSRDEDEKGALDHGLMNLEAQDKSGRVFPVEVSISTGSSEDGDIFVSFIRDISQRVAAETELISTRDQALAGEQAKANLLAVMSHEMRTPMNGFLGTLQILKGTKLDVEQRDLTRVMETSGRMLLRHVNSVLDISRVDAGKAITSESAFNLLSVVEDLVESQKASATARGNTIGVRNIGAAGDCVFGDKDLTTQILLNLIGNAIKFTKNGQIWVDVDYDHDGERVEIRVEDTGIGILEENLGSIFEDFTTVDASYSREVEGTGLGLSIVRRLTELMGGELGVESVEGIGSTFWVVLPFSKTDTPPTIDRPEELTKIVPSSVSHSVLLVEDNEINRLVAKNMLERLGCKISVASDGLEGVAKAETEPFDLILMDISMPLLDGVSACEKIRSGNGLNAKTPIVAVTAHALPRDIHRFHEAGMSDVIIKPIAVDQVSEIIGGLKGAKDSQPEPKEISILQGIDENAAVDILTQAHREIETKLSAILGVVPENLNAKDLVRVSHELNGLAAIVGFDELREIFAVAETAALEDLATEAREALEAAQELLSHQDPVRPKVQVSATTG